MAFCLLWSTADLGALHIDGFGYVSLVCGGDELQLLSGGAHLERILLHRRTSGKKYSRLQCMTSIDLRNRVD